MMDVNTCYGYPRCDKATADGSNQDHTDPCRCRCGRVCTEPDPRCAWCGQFTDRSGGAAPVRPDDVPRRFTKRAVTIEAMQLTADNAAKVMLWLGEHRGPQAWTPGGDGNREHISIITLEGDMRADVGDWIIRGVKGEFYPCKPDIFDATYSPAEPDGYICPSILVIAGEAYSCTQMQNMLPGSPHHGGWAHSNADVEAIWTDDKGNRDRYALGEPILDARPTEQVVTITETYVEGTPLPYRVESSDGLSAAGETPEGARDMLNRMRVDR